MVAHFAQGDLNMRKEGCHVPQERFFKRGWRMEDSGLTTKKPRNEGAAKHQASYIQGSTSAGSQMGTLDSQKSEKL
jgi:hypothetical protein